MKLHDLASNQGNSAPSKIRGGNAFTAFLKSVLGRKDPVLVDGYMRKGPSDEFIMFSESARSANWSEIAVRNVRALEYFGREFAQDGVCAKVRLTL
ncbi:MAG TPA: hypothetical protein VMU48_01740 [Terracidiphilus sp.]|nr:hypothetical protein [Terracidiphilus sp.]